MGSAVVSRETFNGRITDIDINISNFKQVLNFFVSIIEFFNSTRSNGLN